MMNQYGRQFIHRILEWIIYEYNTSDFNHVKYMIPKLKEDYEAYLMLRDAYFK